MFAKFCKATDEGDEDARKEGSNLLNISFENQCIIDALLESIRGDGKKIKVTATFPN